MRAKTVLKFASVVFALGAVLHLWRLLAGFDVIVNEWVIPRMVSVVAVVVAGYIAYQSYNLSK